MDEHHYSFLTIPNGKGWPNGEYDSFTSCILSNNLLLFDHINILINKNNYQYTFGLIA